MKIATKLTLTAALVAAFFLTDVWLDYRNNSTVQERLLSQRSQRVAEFDALREMAAALSGLQTLLRRSTALDTPEAWASHLRAANGFRTRFDRSLVEAATVAASTRADALAELRQVTESFDQLWADYAKLGTGFSPQAPSYAERMLLPHLTGEMQPALDEVNRRFQTAQAADYDAGLAELDEARRRTLIITGLFVVLLLGGAYALHRDIVRSLRTMELDAKKVLQGVRSGARFHYGRHDELGAVAHAFNDALDTLHSSAFSIDELEQKVRERSAEIARREQQLRDIFDNTSDLIQSATPSGTLLFANRAWRERLGYRDEDLAGRSLFEFVAADCQEFIRSKFRLLLTGKSPEMFDMTLVASNGERVLVEGQITARFENKQPVATRGIFRDVTERRRAEEALRTSQAQLHRVIKGSQQCYWDWNIQTGEVLFSGRWAEMFGHRLDALEPTFAAWENLLHPDDRPTAIEALQQHIAGDRPNYECEHRMLTSDGEWKWILTRGLVVGNDREGKAVHLAGTHTDIHARKLAEESLRQREQQLRLISDNFPEGTLYQFIRNADGTERYTFIGGGFERIFGTGPEAMMGDATWIEQQMFPEYLQAAKEAGAVSQRDRTPFRQEVRIRTVTGEEKWLSFRSQPRRAEDGGTIWEGVITDVTLNKEAEATIARQVAFFSALNETTLDLLNRLEKSQLLQAIVERAATLIDAPHVELSLLEGDELVTAAYCGSSTDVIGERVTRDVAKFSWRAIDNRRPEVVDDYSTIPEAREIYRERGSRAAAVFPILHGDECLGVLGLLRHRAGHTFSKDDRQKGQLLARLVALVLHNSEIYENAVHEAAHRMRALSESERRLREAQRLAHLGHWEFLFTSGMRYERWSDETYRIFGLEPQSVVIDRARFESLIYPPDLPTVRATVDKAFAEFIPFVLNYRLIRPDGEIREVRDQGEPKFGPTGEVIGMHGVMQDITERTAALAALRESEERNRQIIDTALDAVVTMDQQGRITGWNPQAEAIFGWDAEAAIGQTVTETFLPTTLVTKNNVALSNLFSSGKGEFFNRRLELRALHRNGHELPVELSIAPVTINGKPHFSAFLRDITTQRQTETHLRQAQKMESLGTLAGGIAHDFNNLLTGMFGFMELARMELSADHPARFSLDKIAGAAVRAKNLVQ